jgi:hypothetical protein
MTRAVRVHQAQNEPNAGATADAISGHKILTQ